MSVVDELRLGVNIDHVATVRNARGGALPEDDSLAKASTFAAQTLLEVTKRL